MYIRSAAVLGAGTMGAQIAAHLANARVPVLLLDRTAEAASAGLERAKALKPDPFFTAAAPGLIRTGSIETSLPAVAGADWIVEAVVEQLDVKRDLLARVDRARRAGSIVSSNTSAIPIAALAEGRSDDFRRCWLGTHFFNPPRYLHLLEVIPTPGTDAAVVAAVSRFADECLGKGVVTASDTPGFVGNRVALFELLRSVEQVARGACTIEEVDAITGPLLGRAKSATFRTADLAGLDVVAHVVSDLHARLPEGEREWFALPPLITRMLERGLLGEKAGGGFYRRVRTPDGSSAILTLDPATLEYRPREVPALPSIDGARASAGTGARVARLLGGDDTVGRFLRATLAPSIVHAGRVAEGTGVSPDAVDRALRWGFGWDMGPFELADAAGLRAVVDAATGTCPALLRDGPPEPFARALAAGRDTIRDGALPAAGPDLEILRAAKDRSKVVRRNDAASLVDLGDGALALEFHSKMNTLGSDTLEMLEAGLAEAEANFEALVVGNEAPHFSAGANLVLVVGAAEERRWEYLSRFIRAFQRAFLALRTSAVPVVVAPRGLALGGGCEIALHADRVQAAAETYIGLVETGIGLIPGWGGTKEVVARAAEATPPGGDLLPAVRRAFETVALGRASTSGAHARELGYLRPVDGITANHERLIADAKAVALSRARGGYQPPPARAAIRVGGDAVRAPLALGVHLARRAGQISDHDARIGLALAGVMAGGAWPHPTTVSETYLLDLERDAFLGLLGEQKTLDRIRHTLATGKPLRN